MVFLVVFLFYKPMASCMLGKHPLKYGVCAPALRFVVEMCQTMMVGDLAVTIYQ